MWDRLKTLSLSIRILLGLALGAVIGLALPSTGRNEGVDQFVEAAAIGGKLWLQALQMTILPLVFGLVATLFIRSKGVSKGTGAARRAFYVMMALYVLSVPVGALTTEVFLTAFPVTQDMAQAMRAMAGESVSAESLHWQDTLLAIVPVNIIEAMAGPSLLPVLFFALVFGAALASMPTSAGKQVLSDALTGLVDVAFVIVEWVLRLAPIGVLLLILPTTQRFGADIFAGLAHWVAFSCASLLFAFLVVYVVVALTTRVGVMTFAKAILPAQSVAAGTQSSTGTMPITIESCRRMGLAEESISATMPLVAVAFRFIGPPSFMMTSAYAAAVYGISSFGIAMLIAVGLLGILMEMGTIGIPNTATAVAQTTPFAALVGFPIEFIVVLLVVEIIPDIFKTVTNVTAHAAATAIVDRGINSEPVAAE